MARSRLMLVAVKGNYEGPWQHANGMKRAVVDVRGLAPDDGVRIEYEERTGAGLQLGATLLGLGSNSVIMEKWTMFRVCKTVWDGGLSIPTTVEIFEEDK